MLAQSLTTVLLVYHGILFAKASLHLSFLQIIEQILMEDRFLCFIFNMNVSCLLSRAATKTLRYTHAHIHAHTHTPHTRKKHGITNICGKSW